MRTFLNNKIILNDTLTYFSFQIDSKFLEQAHNLYNYYAYHLMY